MFGSGGGEWGVRETRGRWLILVLVEEIKHGPYFKKLKSALQCSALDSGIGAIVLSLGTFI